jgi:magnesium-transporting ATPase (P-type)/class 3 adenylate cyclase
MQKVSEALHSYDQAGKNSNVKNVLMAETTGGDIFVGDIIKLRQGESCPCDMLILATSTFLHNSQVCTVDSMYDDGKCNRQVKYGVSLTKSFNHLTHTDNQTDIKKFLKLLYARVEYHRISDTHKITGTFKLKADPRVEQFDNKNTIDKGSILKSSYIYGLVLYNGMNCLDARTTSSIYLTKSSGVESKMKIFSLSMIFLNLIFCILFTIGFGRVRLRGGRELNTFFEPNTFVSFVSLLFSAMPMTASILLNVFYATSAFILQRQYRGYINSEEFKQVTQGVDQSQVETQGTLNHNASKAAEFKNSFKILNPNVIPDLGDVDDAFFDKTGTISSNSYVVESIATRSKIYGCKNTSFNPKNLAIIDPEKSIQKDNNTDKSVLKNRLEAGDGNFEPTLNSKRSVKHEVPKWDFKTRVMGATPFDSPETESLKEHDTPPVNGSSLLTVSRMNNVDLKSMSKFQKAINIHSKNNLSQSDKLKQTQSQPAQKFDPNIIHTPEDFETDFKYTSEIKELLLMFATCHKATAHDNTFESDNIEERALLRLASQYHINFEKNIIREDSVSSKTPSQKAQPLNYYLIRDRHKVASKTSYYFISEYDPDRKRFSILIRDNKAGEAVLYVRGTNDSMRGLLNFTDPAGMSQYDSVIEHNTKRGLRPVVFATRRMTLEEADKHYNEYMAISRSSLDQEGRMATLNKNLETNLTFMAVVGFKNMVKNDSLVTFEYLKEMGVNVHMLSGDNKEHCMMAVHSLNLLSSKDRYIELNFVNVDAGRSQIKRALDEVGKNLEKTLDEEKLLTNEEKKDLRRSDTLSVESLVNSKNLFIVISGAALDVIFTDKYLYEHTKFIFEFAKTLVGYSLSPNNKASIVKIFKSLERVTMAVGDGFNDVNMIQASHVGFQMVSPNVGYQFGDILINNIYSIPVAMNRRCRSWNDNLHIAIHNLYKYSLTLLIISGLYQIYCLISGAPILSSYLFLTAMFFMVPLVTIFVFFNERYSPAFRSTVKGLYSEKNYLTRAVGFRVLCFHLLPECFVEGAVILIISLHSLHSNIRELGFLETKEQLTLLITLLAYLAFCFNNIICCEHKRLMMTVVSVLVLALMFLVLYILFEIRLYTVNYQVAIVVFVDNWNTMMLLLILALLILMISNGVWTVFSHPKYYPVYHIIQRSIAYQNREVLDSLAPEKNELFLNLYKHTDPFTATFKKCFSDKSEVNIVLTNLMLPSSGAFDNSISGWAMKLRSKMLYKKYMIYASKRFIRIMRVALGVGTVGLFIYLLLTALLDKFSTGQTAWVNSFIFILLPLLYYFSFDTKWALKINTYAILFQLCLVVSSILYCLSYRTDYSILGSLVLIFLSLHYNVEFSVFFCLAIISLVGYALTFLANIASIRESAWGGDGIIFPLISISFEYFGITLAVIIQRRKNERLIKEEFITGADLDSTAVLAKNLLALLLPKFVMDRMKNFLEISGEKQVFDDEDKVAIMFCDIADFDDVVRKNENNIVHLLHKIFRRFDDLCIIHGVQKIETVGKTYMAAAGLKAVESGLPQDISKINPTLRILNFCKDMMTIIKDYEGLKLKIGVHVGRPVVGVIGYHKPQFSLIGDVVNTTSRHCTTGDKGHIMLSEAAWAEVKDKLPLSMGYAMETKQAFMKGKGNVDVYHLFEKKNLFLAFIKSIAQNKDNLREPNLYIQAETLHRALEAIRKRNRFADLKIFKLLEQIKTGNLLKDLYKDVNLKASMNFPANTQDSDMKNQRALLGDRTNSRKYTDKIISDSSQLIDNGLKKTETEDLDEQEDEDKVEYD